MYQKQKGASMWQWLFVGGMVAVFAYVGLQLSPVYYEHMGVTRALRSLDEVGGSSMTKQEATKRIMAQFQVNQVTRVKKENISFKNKRNGGMDVMIEYDVKIPLVGNMFILVEFRDKASI